MRAAIALGRACDGACVFCAQEGLPREARDDEGVRGALADARAQGHDAVTFSGGEPALDPRLETRVREARAMGFTRVGVQTNGRALAERGRADSLAQAGLTDLHLSIHGADARSHDWHAGVPGAFDAALRTLTAARAAALEVVVATVLTRSSFRGLGAMPRLLASRGVSGWCIEVARWRGRAAPAADRVVPRLALALPFALHALDAAESLGLPAFVRGAPSCLLGPWVTRAVTGEARGFAAVCATCPSRASCAGADAEYLARFGAGELTARALDPRAVPVAHEEVRAMFVGLGEVAPPAEAATIAPSPARARVALPMLGKPEPGRGEVAASSPKQTGEALRAILPGLFDDGPARKP